MDDPIRDQVRRDFFNLCASLRLKDRNDITNLLLSIGVNYPRELSAALEKEFHAIALDILEKE